MFYLISSRDYSMNNCIEQENVSIIRYLNLKTVSKFWKALYWSVICFIEHILKFLGIEITGNLSNKVLIKTTTSVIFATLGKVWQYLNVASYKIKEKRGWYKDTLFIKQIFLILMSISIVKLITFSIVLMSNLVKSYCHVKTERIHVLL